MKKQLLLLLVALLVVAGAKAQSIPTLIATPNTLDSLNYVGHGPSIVKSYTLEGRGLNSDKVNVSVSNYFEISFTENDGFTNNLEIPIAGDTLENQPIIVYVRLMADLSEDEYQENIQNKLGSLALSDVQVSGSVVFTTPTVILDSIFNIEETSAVANGIVTDDGGATIDERGVCWNTTGNPEYPNDNHQSSDGTLGEFEVNINNLNPNTTYYIRAYAKNSKGTAYSEQKDFKTAQEQTVPTVITAEVTNIGQTTATGGGDVTHDGNVDVTARGICWSTSHVPTINDAFSNEPNR